MSLQSWSSHLFRGRPGHCLQLGAGRRPNDRLMCHHKAWWAVVSLGSNMWLRPVKGEMSVFCTWSYQWILAMWHWHFMWINNICGWVCTANRFTVCHLTVLASHICVFHSVVNDNMKCYCQALLAYSLHNHCETLYLTLQNLLK